MKAGAKPEIGPRLSAYIIFVFLFPAFFFFFSGPRACCFLPSISPPHPPNPLPDARQIEMGQLIRIRGQNLEKTSPVFRRDLGIAR